MGPWASLWNPWGSLVVLGPSLESFGGALGCPRGSGGVLGSAVGRPWDLLGAPWGSLGTPWDVFGCPQGSIGAPWGPFRTLWLVLKNIQKPYVFDEFPTLEATLGDTWACLVCSLRLLGALWESLRVLVRSLGSSWSLLGSCGVLGLFLRRP